MPATALLVLDLQRDFLEEAGRMPIARHQMSPLLAVANEVIDAAVSKGAEVVYIENAFPRSQRVLNFLRRGASIAGTPGAEMDPRVHRAPGASHFPKEQGDAFTNAELDAHLRRRGVERLAIVGVFAPACVRATARGALGRGYRVTVLGDGVGAGSDLARKFALWRLAADGATIADSASFAFP